MKYGLFAPSNKVQVCKGDTRGCRLEIFTYKELKIRVLISKLLKKFSYFIVLFINFL